MTLKVGVNLLWLRSGQVGGSQEYLIRQLLGLKMCNQQNFAVTLFVQPGFGKNHPELAAIYEYIEAPKHGGRPSLVIAFAATAISCLIGIVIGSLAALAGGWIDDALSRVIDFMLALPTLILLLLISSFFGQDPFILSVALGLMYAAPIARVARSATQTLLARDFVRVARLQGGSRLSILFGEVLPNVWRVMFTEVAMQFTWILLAFSSLSFLGLGASPPTPEWGLMIAESRSYMTLNPLLVIAPIVMLASLVLAIQALVDHE